MLVQTELENLLNSVDRCIENDLKDLIKAKLMPHAETVVEEVAKTIANGMQHQIVHWKRPMDGNVEVHIHLGPKDKQKHLQQKVSFEVVD